jgi:hypothetical protein
VGQLEQAAKGLVVDADVGDGRGEQRVEAVTALPLLQGQQGLKVD